MARADANTNSSTPITGIVIAVAVLYFARELLIPFAFALLLAFLLGPIVKKLEGLRIRRVPAAAIAFLVAGAVVTIVGWFVVVQLIQIATSLPKYSDNVRRKIEVLQGDSRSVSAVISAMEDIGKQLGTREGAGTPRGGPMQVEVVEQHTIIQVVRDNAGGLLKPLGTLGLIMVFTIFMLIDRENLRNRLLRLMGQGKLQATTKAMDDAGHRVSRYILMQFAVNTGFGAIIGTGLYFLGVPSALVWGVLGIFLRFLPYVGPVVAWVLPFVLTLAVSDGWSIPLSVTGLFFVTELIIANFVEPLLYGVHTGLSAVAILVSAVFWTVIWGPVGLVLATPLTVCLSALGRHSPQLEFLNVVLGDEQVLTPEVMFYQRLLALDQNDALAVLETYGKGRPLIDSVDGVVLPALGLAERDRLTGQLDPKREDFVVQSINEFVTDLTEAESHHRREPADGAPRVFCVPAHDSADEIAAAMCAHFLTQEGFPAIAFPVTESPADLMEALGVQEQDVVCVSAVPPFAGGNSKKVIRAIREKGMSPVMIAGLWTSEASTPAQLERMRKSLSAFVATSIGEAVAIAHSIRNGDRSAG